jgi:hypothetical protein
MFLFFAYSARRNALPRCTGIFGRANSKFNESSRIGLVFYLGGSWFGDVAGPHFTFVALLPNLETSPVLGSPNTL